VAHATLLRLRDCAARHAIALLTGQPNDIATATGLVIQIYGVVKEAYLKAQPDAQAAKAAQPPRRLPSRFFALECTGEVGMAVPVVERPAIIERRSVVVEQVPPVDVIPGTYCGYC
jgi:hypothetical protein